MADAHSEFRRRLEDAVQSKHSSRNPFTDMWVKGELTKAQLGGWAKQHYQYVSKFPQWCAAVYAECPYPDARDFLLENIMEEEAGVKHTEYLLRFAEACGVKRQEVLGARELPTTRALTSWCYHMSKRPFYEAAAGLLVGLESQVPQIYQRNLPPLREHYDFSPEALAFFEIHITADEVHGERGYEIVEKYCDTPQKQALALERVQEATEMRWQYMSGLAQHLVG